MARVSQSYSRKISFKKTKVKGTKSNARKRKKS